MYMLIKYGDKLTENVITVQKNLILKFNFSPFDVVPSEVPLSNSISGVMDDTFSYFGNQIIHTFSLHNCT